MQAKDCGLMANIIDNISDELIFLIICMSNETMFNNKD